jgi:3-hydroxybutyryl-CoA dehydratase
MKPFAEFAIGESADLSKTVTEQDVVQFADISLDRNPVHLDQAYAEASFFKQRIAHGMLGAALISAVLGTKCPGPGSIYLSQDLKFRAPVYLGETITATVEILEKNEAKKILILKTVVDKADGTRVIEGQAAIKLFA